MHQMVLLCDEAHVELLSVRLGIVLILTEDRCMVCAKRTTGSEIIGNARDGTPRWCWSCGISFRSIWRQY
jgi:hypothetical protein